MKSIFVNRREQREDHWISISDLMAGLMMIFLFIAISYMIHVSNEKKKILNIAETYATLKIELYNDLIKEFKQDLIIWKAEIDSQTLSVRFKEPEVFFNASESNLKSEFKNILSDFFPRYIKVLNNKSYVNDIEEVRIEGHTSSEWGQMTGTLVAYLENMKLSQNRTRSVLEYVMNLKELKTYKNWLIKHVTANGLSYSHRIIKKNKKEDYKKSRRVEFRIRTKAENRIEKILNMKNN